VRERPAEQRRPPQAVRREPQDDAAEETSPAPVPAKPAVSLWQKIFGAPAEPTVKSPEIEEARTPDERPFVEPRRDVSDVIGESGTISDEAEAAAADREAPDRLPLSDGVEAPSSDQPTRRRSRRRRGGRGRGSDEPQEARYSSRRRESSDLMETPGADDFDDLTAEDSDDMDLDEAAATGEAGEELEVGDGARPSTSRSRSAAHRSIPSWDEAIGMIVDSNMQTRSQRRASSPAGPRGRSRGGRRRRKPS
jgi:hypothetical protein